MTEAGERDGMDEARRRARAAGRRRWQQKQSTEWPQFGPPVGLAHGPLGRAQAADREIARQTSVRARAVAAFAASRPVEGDRAQGEPGAMSADRWAARPELLRPVSEWATPELSVALSISTQAADTLLLRSLTLVHRLPGTLAALEAGALHPGHLGPLLEHVAPIEDDTLRAQVEAGLLRWAAGRVTTPAQLGAKARREVARCDARAAARRLEKALRSRGVHLSPEAPDGLAAVTALLTEPEAQVFYRALGAYADQVSDDPARPRTRAQKMADCLMDLVLRPGGVDLVQVQVLLTVVASIGTLAGGDEVGEVNGRVVPPEMIRELLRLFGPRSECEADADCDCDSDPDAAARSDAGAVTRETGAEPTDGDVASARRPIDADDLEQWWAETEQRVFAELDDPDPEPIPHAARPAGPDDPDVLGPPPDPQELAEWASSPAGMTWLLEQVQRECWSAELDRRALSGGFALRDPDRRPRGPARGAPAQGAPAPGAPTPSGETPPDRSTADPSGGAEQWWVAADRAVDEASRALLALDRATGRARRLVRTAVAADAADEAAWQATHGPLGDAEDALAVLRACSDVQRAWLAELLIATGGGGLVERPRIALTDALTGALLALTDLPELRRTGHCGARACRRDPAGCTHDLSGRAGLGPPGPTDGYRPSLPLDRWVRARDRRCRFPGCRRRVPRAGELDHNRPYPDGPTSATNLNGFCTGHHRGKHQAPGWDYELAPDGTLTVTTPSGLVAVTEPPPF